MEVEEFSIAIPHSVQVFEAEATTVLVPNSLILKLLIVKKSVPITSITASCKTPAVCVGLVKVAALPFNIIGVNAVPVEALITNPPTGAVSV